MDITSECDICHAKIARFTCKNCGKKVCEDHYNAKIGLCTGCMQNLNQSDI